MVGYNVFMGSSPGSLSLHVLIGSRRSYTIDGLENGAEYHFAVAARNNIGPGPASRSVSATPLGVPSVPVDIRIEVVGQNVALSWKTPEDDGGSPVTGYTLLRRTSTGDLEEVASLGPISSFTDTDLDAGTTYYYVLVARSDVGAGDRSEPVEAMIERTASIPREGLPISMVVGGLCLTVLVGLAAAAATEPGKYQLSLWAMPLLMKTSKEDILNNKTRYTLHGYIIDHPGIHLNAILKELALPVGAVTYHLDILEKEQFIRSVRDGRLKRFYTTDVKIPENLRMTPEEIRGAILHLVTSSPSISQKDIIRELGADRKTVGYHLRELVKEGYLMNERQGKFVLYRVIDQ